MEHRPHTTDLVVSNDDNARGNQLAGESSPDVAQKELLERKQVGGPVNCTHSELYIYLQALGEDYLATYYSDTSQYVQSRSTPIVSKSYQHGKKTVAFHGFPSLEMSRSSTESRGEEKSMLFQGDSPVRTYRRQETGQDSTASGLDCGPSLPGSLAKCSPPLCGWKTRQCSLFGGLTEFSGTWPRWGTMRDGELFQQDTPGHLTNGNAAGFWPTPKAVDFKVDVNDSGEYARRTVAAGFQDALPFWIKRRWPGRRGVTNLDFVDWLMGWPIGWSAITPLATDKCQLASPWRGRHSIPKMMVDWLAAHGIVLETDTKKGFQHDKSRET